MIKMSLKQAKRLNLVAKEYCYQHGKKELSVKTTPTKSQRSRGVQSKSSSKTDKSGFNIIKGKNTGVEVWRLVI